VTSPRARLAALLPEARFPLDRADLLLAVERAGDEELLAIVSSLQDDHYVDADELDHRLEDALGMPDALGDQSALAPDEGWPTGHA
jgi:hypothetical protein